MHVKGLIPDRKGGTYDNRSDKSPSVKVRIDGQDGTYSYYVRSNNEEAEAEAILAAVGQVVEFDATPANREGYYFIKAGTFKIVDGEEALPALRQAVSKREGAITDKEREWQIAGLGALKDAVETVVPILATGEAKPPDIPAVVEMILNTAEKYRDFVNQPLPQGDKLDQELVDELMGLADANGVDPKTLTKYLEANFGKSTLDELSEEQAEIFKGDLEKGGETPL